MIGAPDSARGVVHGDQAATAHEFQQPLVVDGVVGLIGVNEREVEAARFTRREQRVERLESGPDSQVDAICDSRLAPKGLADGSPLGVPARLTACGGKRRFG